MSDALQERKDWIGVQWADPGDEREVRLLDYASGTGNITRALGGFVTTIRGIDISEKMVDEYNKAIRSSGMKTEQANAVVGDLCTEDVQSHLDGKEYYDFDIVAIGLGFHHFENLPLSTKRLAERLRSGGVLLIVDFLPFDSEAQHRAQPPDADTPDMSATIKHSGFTEEGIKKLFGEAGLEDARFDVVGDVDMELKKGWVKRTVSISKGINYT